MVFNHAYSAYPEIRLPHSSISHETRHAHWTEPTALTVIPMAPLAAWETKRKIWIVPYPYQGRWWLRIHLSQEKSGRHSYQSMLLQGLDAILQGTCMRRDADLEEKTDIILTYNMIRYEREMTHKFPFIFGVSILNGCQRRRSTRICLIGEGSDIARIIAVRPLET